MSVALGSVICFVHKLLQQISVLSIDELHEFCSVFQISRCDAWILFQVRGMLCFVFQQGN